MSDLYFTTDLFSQFDRLHQQMATLFGGYPSSIRSDRLSAFPQINIGTTDDTIDIVAFAPGIDPKQLEVSIDKGLLTIAGERAAVTPDASDEAARHYARERFSGAFRRVIELPQHADPDKVEARYVNGCLCITVGKRESSRPRAITVQ
ncbi:hsp20/alpha crystallin family protein [Paraburkholderia xenovorans LB400]|jgi:HSP20 family protein|uniref:Heat shock protein n=2 Tax=Paraburkholderia TaxID=1822464 RepID=Q13QP6_PARXL|nr:MULTISPECIES: Hsp20/alpha crystallin family protein [Paraburkholderia]EIF33148.1 molecular chaperone (small heat shock protein) [Burkholderia sp. Ch1-1]ABE33593.1 Putative heat shock protein [Paraburkholderia xenovorans LB400]AIP35755.1 hsp20/alpha crystallin family protein [Paraburkholderia xenovorans LB400]MDR8399987.1 Hsp20/alpha crystallin family protein [Paraburkholderia sp. USG1]NPT34094.1 Hsp20 family protein [Paraburkholderia xenovorans]